MKPLFFLFLLVCSAVAATYDYPVKTTMNPPTANRAATTDANGKMAVSAVTTNELSYLSGVTSALQTQLNNRGLLSDTNSWTGTNLFRANATGFGSVTNPASRLSNADTLSIGLTPATNALTWEIYETNAYGMIVSSYPSSGVGFGLRVHTKGTTANDFPFVSSSGTAGGGWGTISACINGLGYLGLGQTNAAYRLDLNDIMRLVGTNGINFDGTVNNANHTVTINAPSANTLAFYNSGTERMRMSSTGRIGIGTASPSASLHVYTLSASNISAGSFELPNSATSFGSGYPALEVVNSNGTANNWSWLSFADSVGGAAAAAIFVQHTDKSSHYADFNITTRSAGGFSRKLTVKAAGNIGIGETSPQYLLDSSGAIRIIGSNKLNLGGTSGAADADASIARTAAGEITLITNLVAGGIYAQAGSTTNRIRVSGQIYNTTTAITNTATTEVTLMSYTVPASALTASGDAVEVETWLQTGTDSSSKSFMLYFGSTKVVNWTGVSTTNNLARITAKIVRTGAATQIAQGDTQFVSGGGTAATIRQWFTSPAETLSSTVLVKLTSITGTNGDATNTFMRININPAP